MTAQSLQDAYRGARLAVLLAPYRVTQTANRETR